MNTNELKEIVNKCVHKEQWGDLINGLLNGCEEDTEDLEHELKQFGITLKYKSSNRINEEFYLVIEVNYGEDTSYFEFDGWYSSYEGSQIDDFDKFDQVKEVDVVVKQWQKVRNS